MRNQLRLLRDVSALVLIVATWRLWFTASDFPAVPFSSFLTETPRGVDRILSSLLVISLLIDAAVMAVQVAGRNCSQRFVRIGQICDSAFVMSAVLLILLNQHCLQPWMYHFLIMTPLLWPLPSQPDQDAVSEEVVATSRFSEQTIIWLTASIYVWSAWSKLDASFLQYHGPKFVRAICEVIGLSTSFWSEQTWRFAAAMLPVGELLVGVALLFRKTRTFGLVASVAMHFLLMIAVGPWGLNHEAGVLIWNVFFIVQNVILLLPGTRQDRTCVQVGSRMRFRAPCLVVIGAILFPAFRTVGCCDTWPAWAVYASSPARVLVQVHDDSVETLPTPLKKFVEQRTFNDGWSWLRIDYWSLAATGTPLYPEDRFQLGVARFVLQEVESGDGIRIIHEEESDRWTGERNRSDFQGQTEISGLAEKFRLNSKPR